MFFHRLLQNIQVFAISIVRFLIHSSEAMQQFSVLLLQTGMIKDPIFLKKSKISDIIILSPIFLILMIYFLQFKKNGLFQKMN